MNSNSSDERIVRRVLIAIDASHGDPGALQMATALAARHRAELMTLLIEDLDLLQLAELPFASEIDQASAVERRLDSRQIARSYKKQAQQLRQALDQLVSTHHVSYSMKIVRGRFLAEALAAAANVDIVFLNRMTARPGFIKKTTAFAAATQGTVCAVYNGSAGADRALAMARDLADAEHKQLVILLHDVESGTMNRLRDQYRMKYALEPESETCIELQDKSQAALFRTLRENRCNLLLLSGGDEEKINQLSQALLDELDCMLVVVP